MKVCKQFGNLSFVSESADGVESDASFICHQLLRFLRGKVNHVSLLTPTTTTNLCYQVIGSSCVLLLGDYVIDLQMLVFGGVAKDI